MNGLRRLRIRMAMNRKCPMSMQRGKRETMESDEEEMMQPWDCSSVHDVEKESAGNADDVSIDIISVENGAQEEEYK